MIRSFIRSLAASVSPFPPRFHSSEEFFAAVDDLRARLERAGHVDAARELGEGLSGLNGLTDGWAFLLESIERVRATSATSFGAEEQRDFRRIRAAVRRLVFRG